MSQLNPVINQRDINYIINAHSNYPTKESRAFRKFDGQTPYFMHPLWCATTIATETNLPEQLRKDGTLALLYHDLLEDTKIGLPIWLNNQTKSYIQDMTYEGGNAQEMQEIWSKPKEIRLFKLYDKVSNLLDSSWMNEEKSEIYYDYTMKLCQDVELHFNNLNITKIASGILYE